MGSSLEDLHQQKWNCNSAQGAEAGGGAAHAAEGNLGLWVLALRYTSLGSVMGSLHIYNTAHSFWRKEMDLHRSSFEKWALMILKCGHSWGCVCNKGKGSLSGIRRQWMICGKCCLVPLFMNDGFGLVTRKRERK